MKNYIQPGDTLTLIAAGTITAGSPVKIGQIFGLAVDSAVTGEQFELQRRGVVSTTLATSGEAWSAGDLIYWSGTAFRKTPSAGDLLVGFAALAKASGTTSATILLDGTARANQ